MLFCRARSVKSDCVSKTIALWVGQPQGVPARFYGIADRRRKGGVLEKPAWSPKEGCGIRSIRTRNGLFGRFDRGVRGERKVVGLTPGNVLIIPDE